MLCVLPDVVVLQHTVLTYEHVIITFRLINILVRTELPHAVRDTVVIALEKSTEHNVLLVANLTPQEVEVSVSKKHTNSLLSQLRQINL